MCGVLKNIVASLLILQDVPPFFVVANNAPFVHGDNSSAQGINDPFIVGGKQNSSAQVVYFFQNLNNFMGI